MSTIFNAKLYLIPSPLLVSSSEVVEAIKNEASVKDIARMAQLSSLSVIGIGSVSENATTLKSGILSNNDLFYLKMKGAIGDILCHFIDKDGNLIDSTIESRLITTLLDTLRSLKNVIGAAAGEDKVEAIKAVLHGGYIDILITDEDTACKLLDRQNARLYRQAKHSIFVKLSTLLIFSYYLEVSYYGKIFNGDRCRYREHPGSCSLI